MADLARHFLTRDREKLSPKKWADLREAQIRYRAHLAACRFCRVAPRRLDVPPRLCSQGADLARVVEVRARPYDLPNPRPRDRAVE